tara:strand:+ start:36 stop:266 length:231 start_codon:yes stop_codon:yes gene_type:complete
LLFSEFWLNITQQDKNNMAQHCQQVESHKKNLNIFVQLTLHSINAVLCTVRIQKKATFKKKIFLKKKIKKITVAFF